jgi:undecaprenyl pyrophosphate phosphatase UppP
MPLLYLALALLLIAITAQMIKSYFPAEGGIRTITNVVLALLIVGMALWLINTYVPMAQSIKTILNIVVVVATCVGVLQAVGLWSGVVSGWNKLVYRVSHPHHETVTPKS